MAANNPGPRRYIATEDRALYGESLKALWPECPGSEAERVAAYRQLLLAFGVNVARRCEKISGSCDRFVGSYMRCQNPMGVTCANDLPEHPTSSRLDKWLFHVQVTTSRTTRLWGLVPENGGTMGGGV